MSFFAFYLVYSRLMILPIILTLKIVLLIPSGLLVGSRCEFTCDKRLHHVYCNPNTDRCECEKKYPVKIGQWWVEQFKTRFIICLKCFSFHSCRVFAAAVFLSHYTMFVDDNNQVLVKAVQNVSCCIVNRTTKIFLVVQHIWDLLCKRIKNLFNSFHFLIKSAKRLEEQCFYDEVCQFNDENAVCTQIDHNAVCQCRSGYHQVSHSKPTRRVFCVQGSWNCVSIT